MKFGCRFGESSTDVCDVYSNGAKFREAKMCSRFVPHTLVTETKIGCIISGPSVDGRGIDLENVRCDQSFFTQTIL